MQLGLTPIRLNPDAQGEVVWCDRIDPARAIIRNNPLPGSTFRYSDLLLHGGAPNGSRMLRGQEVPVFDAIQLVRASPYQTYTLNLHVDHADDLLALAEQAERSGFGIEDWESIRQLCPAAAPAIQAHTSPPQYAGGQVVALALAAENDAALRALLHAWAAAHPASAVLDLMLLVPARLCKARQLTATFPASARPA